MITAAFSPTRTAVEQAFYGAGSQRSPCGSRRYTSTAETYRSDDGRTNGHVGDLEVLHAVYIEARVDDPAFVPRLHGARAKLTSRKSGTIL